MEQKIEKTEFAKIIDDWRKLKVDYCEMEFSCGGDSMNDYSFTFYDDKGKVIKEDKVTELKDYFEEEVFNQVEFYENSDGHYIGEAGTVKIFLNNDNDEIDDDEDNYHFQYSKNAESEFNETFSEIVDIKLNKDEVKFVNEYIENINGEDAGISVNFKKDFIMTEKLDEINKKLQDKIVNYLDGYDIKEAEGEPEGYFRFNTVDEDDDDLNELTLDGNILKIKLWKGYRTFEQSY